MPDPTQLQSFTAGAETAVDVAQIERQLSELWQLAAQSEKDPANRRVTRACLFNLVAYCETDADRDQITGIISDVTSRHPCRAIVVLAKSDGPTNEIGASITAHCHLAGSGGKQVCCEQISIQADGSSVAMVPGAVLPLLESDLPTVLWWRGNFLKQLNLFRRLTGVSDRVIFDSTAWQPPPSLRELAAVINGQPEINASDLSWTRLALWQQLIADAFNEPRCTPALTRLKRCEIVYGCASGAELRAQLLAGWVAAQLQWKADDARTRIDLRCAEDADATAVGLTSVTLQGQDVEVQVHKNHGQQTASVVIHMSDACGLPRTRALLATDEAALLCQELDYRSPKTLYTRALAMAAELFP
jgi:glucose-6-phosphate dehydrogenase assembly protein OpcA